MKEKHTMNKTILTKNTVSKQKMKGQNNTMKKLIFTTCLIVSAAFASFAGIQYNEPADIYSPTTFTITSDGTYGLFLGKFSGYPFGANEVGFVYMNDPTNLIAGTLLGNDSDFFNTHPSSMWKDENTVLLGEFKAGDTIGIWIKNSVGTILSTAEYGEVDFYRTLWLPHQDLAWTPEGTPFVFSMGTPFAFLLVEMNAPAGEPLPGVMAALAIGGCAFLGRKIRGRAKRSN